MQCIYCDFKKSVLNFAQTTSMWISLNLFLINDIKDKILSKCTLKFTIKFQKLFCTMLRLCVEFSCSNPFKLVS